MITEIGESVRVMAVFESGIRPVKFRWRENVYRVSEVTYSWQSTRGSERIIHFSVTDGTALFELSYNRSTMEWRLERLEG